MTPVTAVALGKRFGLAMLTSNFMLVDKEIAVQYRLPSIMMALIIGLLAGCSDDNPEQKSQVQAEKPKYDPIFNPSPEDLAERAAKKKAALPLTNEMPDLPKAERDQYTSMNDPLMPMRLYIAHRSWDEKPGRVAEDLKYLRPQLGVSTEFTDLISKFNQEQNAFDKADLAKSVDALSRSEAASINGNRLVKVSLENLAEIQSYNMETHEFKINTNLFTDKISYTNEERRRFSSGGWSLPNIKGSLYNGGIGYHYAFTGATSLEVIKVEDPSIARAIEGLREDLSLMVYGYVKRVQRPHTNGEPDEKPFIYIQPHFLDIVNQNGDVLHTVDI